MFTRKIIDLFNKIKDNNNEIRPMQIQQILRELGYTFNRLEMDKLYDAKIIPDARVSGTEKRKRITCGLAGLVAILIYQLTGSVLPGYRRTEKLLQVYQVAYLLANVKKDGKQVLVREVITTSDARTEQCNVEADDYDPLTCSVEVPIEDKIKMLVMFLHYWLMGSNDFKDEDFYDSWEIIRNRVLVDKGELKMFNSFQQERGLVPRPLIALTDNASASLVNSLLVVDNFVKTAGSEDIRRLQCWMEIILTFENGSGFIVGEAKSALQGLTTLNQASITDDWWLLAVIYMHNMNPTKYKYGVGDNR